MENKFSPVVHHGVSIAVRFYENDLLLVANGPVLTVYNYKTGEVLISKKIFKRNKIHGIAFQRDTIALYGARSFSILSFSQIMEDGNLVEEEKMVNDWIVSGELSFNGLELFLLTAHNVILSIDSYSKTFQWEKSVFGQKSILYSGSIKVVSKWDVYINAGTVTGSVIIWNLYKEEIQHTLHGHEGAIFNVKTSDRCRYIASCSDDRSIKLWDFTTGELKATAWGHTARIWNLKFFGDEGLVSVSEDLTARTWKITEDEQLVPNHTYELHNGRHIWALDINKDKTYAATGGNDGRIRLIDINPSKIEEETETFELSDIAGDFPLQKTEVVKGIWRLECGLVIITSHGNIFIYRDGHWSLVQSEPRFNNSSLINGFTHQNIISFTGSNGDTLFLRFDNAGKVIKQHNLHTEVSKVVNALSTIDGERLYLLVESPNKQDKLTLHQFDKDLIFTKKVELIKGPTFVSSCFEVAKGLVFLGLRLSSLGIYDLESGEELHLIKKLSLGDTITSIKKVEETNDHVLLIITNRDGLYLYFRYQKRSGEYEFVHTNSIRKGFLEGSLHNNSELILYGFKSSWFYIYNESRDFELAYENCGGVHRVWKLFYEPSKGYEYVYVRDGTLCIRAIPNSPVPLRLSEGTHGKEIRDITIREGSAKLLHVSGAEDTTMKVSTIDPHSGDLRNFWTLRRHTSGLQKVKFLNNELFASSAAREEFFLWKIDEGFEYPLISHIAALSPSTSNPDLRIMDFHHQFVYAAGVTAVGFVLATVYSDSSIKCFYYNLKTSEFTPILSGSYKTCCLWDVQLLIQGSKALILTGATDGHLTMYDVTQEIQFPVVDGAFQFQELDGLSTLPAWSSHIQVHQNGIKDLQVFPSEHGFLVATGGDDNGLGLVQFTIGQDIDSKVVAFESDAASSTITAVAKVSKERIAVISVDQVTRLWSIANGQLTQLDHHYTTIADTGPSDTTVVNGKDYLLIGGVGLSLWEVK